MIFFATVIWESDVAFFVYYNQMWNLDVLMLKGLRFFQWDAYFSCISLLVWCVSVMK
jgi:hypothetical protein